MKANKFFRNSAIVTSMLASLCCITPVLAVLAGLSGIASFFSFLDPLRPYFITFTVIVLGYAFYNKYKPKKETDINCDCEDGHEHKKRFINSKGFLWLVAVIAVVLISFPYYSQVFFPKRDVPDSQNTIAIDADNIVKAKWKLKE